MSTAPSMVRADEAVHMETALRLASLLRSARSVIASEQALINDPAIGDKGLTGDHVLELATKAYLEANGTEPLHDGQDPLEARLIEAQMQAIRTVMADNQATINADGIAFKGFVPAVFGRLVNESFASFVGTEAQVKVTAPPDLVRNRKAMPDEWETKIIADDLMSPDWPKGQVYAELTELGGKPAYRVLVPEYYGTGCLSCHGEPKGEIDITGYPKEGGREGDLGGVISISIFR
ncbi:MAG: DUF3365 domain-containing protein [Proteobacteria bacterium]|nr:DUF3365 domain-containing protein [Pseudomonadota bacterium]